MTQMDVLGSIALGATGRNVEVLAMHATGGLAAAARQLTNAPAVAIVTGFAVPAPGGAAPETDGPIGAACLAELLERADRKWCLVTDKASQEVCAAALTAHDLPLNIRVCNSDRDVRAIQAGLRAERYNLLVFVERLGPNRHGRYLSMRGVDMTSETAPLDQLIAADFRSVGIGDGGNEIGMGKLPAAAVAGVINRGDEIHCVIPTDDLILAGVSNWGAWALAGAAAVMSREFRDAAAVALSFDRWRSSLKSIIDAGAVDGVTLTKSLSVDGYEPEVHEEVLTKVWDVTGLE